MVYVAVCVAVVYVAVCVADGRETGAKNNCTEKIHAVFADSHVYTLRQADRTHTHTHTHTCTHARTHAHTRQHAKTDVYMHM